MLGQVDGSNSDFSPLVHGDIALSINTQSHSTQLMFESMLLSIMRSLPGDDCLKQNTIDSFKCCNKILSRLIFCHCCQGNHIISQSQVRIGKMRATFTETFIWSVSFEHLGIMMKEV